VFRRLIDVHRDDTAEAWYELPQFTKIAEGAGTPKDFKKIENGTALFAAAEAIGFEGISYMESYNVTECANHCAARRECISFNTCKRADLFSLRDALET
jgi:hypothetical protein